MEVIVPVHGNHADANRLFRCLATARNRRRFVVTVVDDASPDPAPLDLPAATSVMAATRILRHPFNRGYAAAVNTALEGGRTDVVLLNSDTKVFDFWLDRLTSAAARDARIGTVTPLSNAATIVSYPFFLQDYAGSLETSWSALDALCAADGAAPVELPTGVGFCMLVRRACLDAAGRLDVARFGTGYGEECDLCRRALGTGWINVAAPDLFVWHRGEGSFGDRAGRLRAEAQKCLATRHPDYHHAVATFIRRDPLRQVRLRLDRLRLAADGRPIVLDVTGQPGAADADVKRMVLQPAIGAGRSGLTATVEGFGPVPNLAVLPRRPSRNDFAGLMRDGAIAELRVPAQPRWRDPLVASAVAAARSLGLPCRTVPAT